MVEEFCFEKIMLQISNFRSLFNYKLVTWIFDFGEIGFPCFFFKDDLWSASKKNGYRERNKQRNRYFTNQTELIKKIGFPFSN